MTTPKVAQLAGAEGVIFATPKACVRDRILRTARELFYRRGIRAVGVDTISSEAGTNKMSFYRCFGSKDALVAEYLRSQADDVWERWARTIAPHAGNPRAQVAALFDLLVTNACKVDSRGCSLANAAVEISDPDHPARAVVEEFKGEMNRRFRELARAMGARKPDELGDALMLLWEGSALTRLTFKGTHGPAENAAKAAQSLIAVHTA